MSPFLKFAFPILLFTACATSSLKDRVRPSDSTAYDYQFQVDHCGSKPCLKISLTFENQNGLIDLQLPNQPAGQKESYRAIQGLKVSGGDLEPTSDPSLYHLKSKAKTWVRVDYDLVQDFNGPLDEDEHYYRPIITEGFFHAFGESIFIFPNQQTEVPRPINLHWKTPTDYPLINSFAAHENEQNLNVSIDRLREGTFLGGKEIRIEKFDIAGNPVWMAFIGKLAFTDDEFILVLKRVLMTERDFWKDQNFPYFFVSAISVSREGHSMGGQGRKNGFALFASETMDRDWLDYILSHELFHTWNGHTITPSEHEERTYWFSEGFTDYYAHLLMLRAQLIDLPEYLKLFNETLRKYEFSEVKNAPVSRVEKDFWNDRAVEKLPYQQGELIAQKWNSEIKHRSKSKDSLDDAMRAQLADAKKNSTPLNPNSVEKNFSSFLGNSVGSQIDRYIEHGETIPLPGRLGACVKLMRPTLFSFEMGYDRRKSRSLKRITGVLPSGPAYAAGLRDGDILKTGVVVDGDPNQEAKLEIERDHERHSFHYLPRGEKLRVRQYEMDQVLFKKNPAKCLNYFLQN